MVSKNLAKMIANLEIRMKEGLSPFEGKVLTTEVLDAAKRTAQSVMRPFLEKTGFSHLITQIRVEVDPEDPTRVYVVYPPDLIEELSGR